MDNKKRKLLLYGGLIIIIISIWVILYSSYRSVNKVPKKAKLVEIFTTYNMVG